MAVTYNNSASNVAYLSKATGLAPSVAQAWLTNEGQSVANPTNPLNIVKGGTPGQTGSIGGFGTYASPQAGLDAAAWLLKANSAYKNILAAIQFGTPLQQAQAIQNSPWAAGHYQYSGISSMVGGTTTPGGGASTPITPAVSTSTNTNPPTGGALSSIPAGTIIDASTVATIVSAIKALPGASQYAPSDSTLTTIVAKYIGKPWNSDTQLNISKDVQNAVPANSPLAGAIATNPFLGAATTVAGGIGIPDVQTAIVFVGIILVGIAFLGVGGLIAIRKK